MKKFTIILIILSLLTLNTSTAKNKCLAFITFNDCSSCYSDINKLSDVHHLLNLNVIIKSNYENTYKYIFDSVYYFKIENSKVIINDSLFEFYNVTTKSKILIIDSLTNKIIFQCTIDRLANNISLINYFALPFIDFRVIGNLPAGITKANYFEIYVNKDNIYIKDDILNSFFKISGNKFTKLISGKNINKEFLHYKYFKSMLGYENNLIFQKELNNLDVVEIGQPFFHNNDIYTILEYHYPVPEQINNKLNLRIKSLFFLGKFTNGKLVDAVPFDFNNFLTKDYDLDETNTFIIDGDKFYFSIFKSDLKGKNYFLGEFIISDSSLKFKNFDKARVLPEYFKNNNLIYSGVDLNYSNDIIFFTLANEFFDLKTNQKFKVTNFISESNFTDPENPIINFYLYDIIKIDNNYLMLIRENKLISIAIFDSVNSKISSRIELKVNPDEIKSFLKFYNSGVVFINDNNQVIQLK